MRSLFLVALLAALALFVLRVRSSDRQSVDGEILRIDQARGNEDLAELGPAGDRATPISLPPLATDSAATATPVDPVSHALAGRLLAEGTDMALAGYTVVLFPSGRRPTRVESRTPVAVTRPDGRFRADTLQSRGPWDIYALHHDPLRPDLWPQARDRVGVAPAYPQGTAAIDEPIFRIAVGPTVRGCGPLPHGVEPQDLVLEAYGEVLPFSSQSGGHGGRAFGAPGEAGCVVARLPPITNALDGESFGIRLATRDGLWSMAVTRAGLLSDATDVRVEAGLEPRGRARLRVEIEGGSTQAAAAEAARYVGWTLPLGDPAREGLGLPASLETREVNRVLRPTSVAGVFELRDLPVGPVEIRQREHLELRGAPGRYKVIGAVLTNAVHGESEPITVRLRRTDRR